MSETSKMKKVINTSMICTDDYQRPIRESWVNHIVKNFEEIQADAPKVSFRDNKYYIFDGQHTVMARIKMNGGEHLDLECEVFYGLSKEDEADLFVKLNSNKKSVTYNEKMNGSYIAGNDETVAIINAITGSGFSVDYKGGSKSPKTIASLNKVSSIWKKSGNDGVAWVLGIINECWPDDRDGVKGSILGGLHFVYVLYGDDPRFSKEEFVNSMKEEVPAAIIREGRELSLGGDKRFAKRMISKYNKNVQAKNRVKVAKLDI